MSSDPSLSRRVTRLENDTESIDELLGEMRTVQDQHTRRLDGIDTTLAQHSQRFDRIDATLTEVLRRLPER